MVQRYAQEHIVVAEIRLQVRCHREIVIGRRILLSCHVHQTQVVSCYPLEGVKVEGALKAGDTGDVLLLAEKAHTDIVPQLTGIRVVNRCDTVFEQRNIVVLLILNDASGR